MNIYELHNRLIKRAGAESNSENPALENENIYSKSVTRGTGLAMPMIQQRLIPNAKKLIDNTDRPLRNFANSNIGKATGYNKVYNGSKRVGEWLGNTLYSFKHPEAKYR